MICKTASLDFLLKVGEDVVAISSDLKWHAPPKHPRQRASHQVTEVVSNARSRSRHGEDARRPGALNYAPADLRVYLWARRRGDRSHQEQEHPEYVHELPPGGVRDVREDELEDRLGQQRTRREGSWLMPRGRR